jgi:Na+/H+ antiporter NhaD/arsenite permease-like protein
MEELLIQPNPWMALPFAVLLGSIALAPLLAGDWWSRHYPKVAFSLAAITLSYYLFGLGARQAVLHTAREYTSFIALIGSLFVVAGGIHITVKGEATPLTNVVYLGLGALVANVLGTTGASMLMIRPWLRMNKYRVTGHHVVFFIFIVSNVGGCLTPIGDPPLFLGYLRGIPFWWVARQCWPAWAVGVLCLLALFFVVDYRNYLRAPKAVRAELAEPGDEWRFDGMSNLVFLGIILGAVFVTDPPFLREGIMMAAAAGSYFTTRRAVHEANHFNFHPIQEVAILFVGIFATMMPALDWLQLHAGALGAPSPGFFYWGSGLLSSVLDNAPTYLSFLKATLGAFVSPEAIAQVQHALQTPGYELATAAEPVRATVQALQAYYPRQVQAMSLSRDQIETAFLLGNHDLNRYIVAVSVGAVFFGANTYIGNGPNFMVKSIAEHQKVHMPTFLGYVFRYSLPFMLPMLALVWWLFFR